MKLTKLEIEEVINFVKKEPCTVQDVSRLIKRSWVTTNNYLKKISDDTGLINIKTFRKGSHGALKVVYYENKDSLLTNDLRSELLTQIIQSKNKTDFDFFDIFERVSDDKKKASHQIKNNKNFKKLYNILKNAEHSIYCFSGNLSFMVNNDKKISTLFQELIDRGVSIKVLCRVNTGSMSNISTVSSIVDMSSSHFELHHKEQPLRGFIIDGKLAYFTKEDKKSNYRPGELETDSYFHYEVIEEDWVSWLEKVFWRLYRYSPNAIDRINQIRKWY